MQAILIVFGLVLGGAVLAVGWLHWRTLIRFGRRGPGWGLGTIALGLVQVVAWCFFPGGPDLWLRPVIALVAAAVVAALLLTRRLRME